MKMFRKSDNYYECCKKIFLKYEEIKKLLPASSVIQDGMKALDNMGEEKNEKLEIMLKEIDKNIDVKNGDDGAVQKIPIYCSLALLYHNFYDLVKDIRINNITLLAYCYSYEDLTKEPEDLYYLADNSILYDICIKIKDLEDRAIACSAVTKSIKNTSLDLSLEKNKKWMKEFIRSTFARMSGKEIIQMGYSFDEMMEAASKYMTNKEGSVENEHRRI